MSMTKLVATVEALKQYSFKDKNGYPLENCQEFLELEMLLKHNQDSSSCLSAKDKETIKVAVLQSAIQNPHQDFSNLAYNLCSALEKVNRFNEPRTQAEVHQV